MTNIRTIAQRAGVSISTVSRVMNNVAGVSDTSRQAVLAAVNAAGYLPEIGRRSTSNIALVYTSAVTLDSPFDAALLSGIYGGLAGSGDDLLLLDAQRSREPGESMTQLLVRKGVRGALLRVTTDSASMAEQIHAEGFPAVVVGSRLDTPGLPCVYSDSRGASREAIEHLIGLGHRRIAIATHVVDDSDHADRLASYRQTLAAHELPYDERCSLRVVANRAGGEQVIRRILSMKPRPTAVYLTDPLTAVGALCEARRRDVRVPQDLSIVGFDDDELRHALVPQLTAVCQNTPEVGRLAVALLQRRLSAAPSQQLKHEVLRCWLDIHESTCAAPAARAPRRSV